VKSAAIVFGKSGIGKWQAMEIRSFIRRCVDNNIPIIPVLLPGIGGIPDDLIFLKELNTVRFMHDIDEDEAIDRLIWGIIGKKVDA
jgi:hypothetical protein